jgi:ubiquinone/menaquinone biosynthesis C-methylase UbiE
MDQAQLHPMPVRFTRDEQARRGFVADLRRHVLTDMAQGMRRHYQQNVAPQARSRGLPVDRDGEAIHAALRNDTVFKAFSAVRTCAQEMTFDVVADAVERNGDELAGRRTALMREPRGSLQLDPTLEVPRNVADLDVHLAPGGYHTEYRADDLTAGAVYDHAVEVFLFGQFGPERNDVGMTMANFVRLRYPQFQPRDILDCGCTIGLNTLPWAQAFPQARVTAIDVAAPVLRYGHARAEALGVPVHFRQMNATRMALPDACMDVVCSSMFLHELPLKDIRAFLREAFRVLRPGGLLWQMELPPASAMPAYENFFLDWDSFYNEEPYYRVFRSQDYRQLLCDAGFAADAIVEATLPRYTFIGEQAFAQAIGADSTFDELTGRIDPRGTRWYGFGAWKRKE